MIEPPDSTTGRVTRLPRLTALRAVAALGVFGYHAAGWTNVRARMFFADGYTGVAFFFVLSGFVLTWSWTPGAVRKFWRRRVARLWPAHLVTAALAVLLTTTSAPSGTIGVLLPNLLLMQAWSPSLHVVYGLNAPSWSLSCEVAFYAALPAVLIMLHRMSAPARARCGRMLFTIAIVVNLVLAMVGPTALLVGQIQPLLRFPEFALGAIAALAVRGGWVPRVSVRTASLLVLVSLVVLPQVPSSLRNLFMTLSFLGLVMAAAVADEHGRSSWLTRRPAVYFGELSFAFYLVHNIALDVCNSWLGHARSRGVYGPELGAGSAAVAIASSLLLALAMAVVLHHVIELPGVRLLAARRATAPALVAPQPSQ